MSRRRVVAGVAAIACLLLVWWALNPTVDASTPSPPLTPVAEEPRLEFLRNGHLEESTSTSVREPADTEAPQIPDSGESVHDTVTFGGVVLRADRTPFPGLVVAVKPLWRVGYKGPSDVLLRAMRKTITDEEGRFSLELSREWHIGNFVYAQIAAPDRTRSYMQGDYVLSDQHVLVTPAEEEWRITGTVRVDRDGLRPLRVRLFSPWHEDVGIPGARLFPLAESITGPRDEVDLCGIVEPLRREEGPIHMFLSSSENHPVARLVFGSAAELVDALTGGLVVSVRDFFVPLTCDEGAIVDWRLTFVERSVFIPEKHWIRSSGPPAIDAVLARDTYRIAGRLADGRVRTGLLCLDGSVVWLDTEPGEHRLDVQLVDESGQPVHRTIIECSPVPHGPEDYAPFWQQAVKWADTDEDGKAAFALSPGRYDLSIRGGKGFQTMSRALVVPCAPIVWTVKPDTFLSVGARFVPPIKKRGALSMMLRRIGSDSWQSYSVGYPAGGNYIDGIAPGRYHLIGFAAGYEADAFVDLKPNVAQRVELVFTPMATVSGRVVTAEGEAVADVLVTAGGEQGLAALPWRSGRTDGEGAFSLLLPPGAAAVTVQAGDVRRSFESLAGTTDLVLVLQ